MKQYTTTTQNARVNAFGCAFFSHGEEDGELATFDDFINVKDLVDHVHAKNAPDLVGKPKLFFFQGICSTRLSSKVVQHAEVVSTWKGRNFKQLPSRPNRYEFHGPMLLISCVILQQQVKFHRSFNN